MRFHVTIAQPRGYLFAHCFNEIGEVLVYGLRRLGHEVSYSVNEALRGAQNIVLGAHLLHEKETFPEGTVLYNLEQIGAGAPIAPHLAGSYPIWDYSPANVAIWHEHGIDAQLVPLGYTPEMTRIAPAIHPDIDVLFYGSISPRRARVLSELQASPRKVEILQAWGTRRDSSIARAKVILNLHHYDKPHLFEIVRVSYLLSNRKAVVCETSDDFPAYLEGAVVNADYDHLVEACEKLLRDTEARIKLQQAGFAKFSKVRESDILRYAISHLPQTAALK